MLTTIDEAARARRVWLKIQRKSVSVTFTKPQVTLKTGVTPAMVLAAQTVRVVSDNRARAIVGEAGVAPVRQAIVYGIRDHPSGDVLDTDIEEGYTFKLDGDAYRIVDVILVPGGKQAIAIVNG